MTETQETPSIKVESSGQNQLPQGQQLQGLPLYHGEGGDAEGEGEPAHHARRPMNAFLIFCKRHRSVVREKHPNLENRSITKILGEWWANLDKEDKASYTGLAKQYKDAFFTANPGFKWYKLPAPPLRNFTPRASHTSTTPMEHDGYSHTEVLETKAEQTNNNHLTKLNYNAQPSTSFQDMKDGKQQMFTPGKLADEAQMGGLSSLIEANTMHQSEDEYSHDRSYQIFTQTGTTVSPFETPKLKESNSNMTPETPKKHANPGSIDRSETYKLYNNEDVSPPAREALNDSEQKMQKLQDELSETSRVLTLSFENSNENSRDNSNPNNSAIDKNKLPKLIDNNENKTIHTYNSNVNLYVPSSNLEHDNAYERGSRKTLNLNYQSSVSSDESQDKDGQFDDMNAYRSKNIFTDLDPNHSRASGRACKGKRYQEFMAFGGLLVNKRQKKENSECKPSHKQDAKNKITYDLNSPTCSWKMYGNYPKENLNTVSEATERGNQESELGYCEQIEMSESAYKFKDEANDTGQVNDYYDENASEHSPETAEGSGSKMFKASDFDLDAKIRALPSLSLEKFQQKKKENKKRKKSLSSSKHKDNKPRLPIGNVQYYPSDNVNRTYFPVNIVDQGHDTKIRDSQNMTYDERMTLVEQRKTAIIGSKKRKPRKISITRLDVNSSPSSLNCIDGNINAAKNNCTNVNVQATSIEPTTATRAMQHSVDLCALTTLAEVAAIKSKIDEDA